MVSAKDRVFIRIDSGGGLTWLRMDNNGRVNDEWSETSVDKLAKESRTSRVIVFVPGQDILLLRATLPTRNRRQLMQALPYALEDQLAQEVDRLHFALGSAPKNPPAAVAVVSKDCMTRWKNYLIEAGIHPSLMVPETLALPITDNQWTLLIDKGITLVRTGLWEGFAVDAANVSFMLETALKNEGTVKPNKLRLIDCDRNSSQGRFRGNSLPGLVTEISPPGESGLVCLAKGLREHETINLLQGEYSDHASLYSQLRPWIPALALALLWLGLEVGVKLFESHRLAAETARLSDRIESIYRATFPDARRIVNPRVQMTQRLAALGAGVEDGQGFLNMLAAIGKPLYAMSEVRLTDLRYRDGSLHMDLEVAELAALDSLKSRLSTQTDYGVEILSASASDGRVSARLLVKRGRQ